ncbi:translation initiation factor IF-2-like [Schistocerca americana]|uniref:translation initiation factor IF-2-like n=1 Tax=Schistocerca americana TaxID=7009 RepID=UPI001F4F14EC|nr:translation initiation factor IF-2-like [Schistocerca americana]
MEEEEHTTQWALFFPLQAGMSAFKSSLPPSPDLPALDKLSPALARLRPGAASATGSAPHSPGGSIGDLMNLKCFGGTPTGGEATVSRGVPLSTLGNAAPGAASGPRRRAAPPPPPPPPPRRPLSCSQRTERLSRLIRQSQREPRPAPQPGIQTLVCCTLKVFEKVLRTARVQTQVTGRRATPAPVASAAAPVGARLAVGPCGLGPARLRPPALTWRRTSDTSVSAAGRPPSPGHALSLASTRLAIAGAQSSTPRESSPQNPENDEGGHSLPRGAGSSSFSVIPQAEGTGPRPPAPGPRPQGSARQRNCSQLRRQSAEWRAATCAVTRPLRRCGGFVAGVSRVCCVCVWAAPASPLALPLSQPRPPPLC